jgi:outer membrane cobalamin receptor
VLLLLDGVPFNSSEDGQFDASLIPTEILDGIDTTYSASSVLYGDGPIAGVLQLRTRTGEAGGQAGGVGDVRERGQYFGTLSTSGAARGFDGLLSGQYLSSKGYELPESYPVTSVENGGSRENAERDERNLFARVGWAPNETSRV